MSSSVDMDTRSSICSSSSSSTVADPPDYHNREIGEWLSPFDFIEAQRIILHSRVPDTGLKPLKSEDYIQWRNGDYKTLVMSGSPGAGKTMAAASIVQDLNEYYKGSPVAVVCVFCDFGQSQAQTTDALVASMLRQLVQAHPVVHSTVASMYTHHSTRSTVPRADEIFASFSMSARQFERVFVVVDALDECLDDQTRAQLLTTLNSFSISLLFTSRPHSSIEQLFERCNHQEIHADQQDIWIYSEERFALSRVGRHCAPDLKQEILKQVVRKAGGIFVIARLLMDALMEIPNAKEALHILQTTPTGVQGTYGKTMQHICEGSNPELKELALYSLLWVKFSRRVLVFSELQEAINTMLKPNDTSQRSASNDLTKQCLVAACAGLITIEDKTEKVRLIHYTAHEYLVKEQGSLWNNVQRNMAVTCVAYLRHILPDLEYSREVYIEEEIRNATIHHPFFDYVLHEWGYHVHACRELKLVNEVLELLASDVHCTLGRMLTYDAMNSPKCTPWSALHFCAHFNLVSTCLEIIDRHEKHHKQGSRSLLFFSKHRRRQSGSDTFLDVQDDYERTPLMIAASRGNVDMVRMLLSRRINADLKDFHTRTSLSYAMSSRSKEVVEILLKHSAESVNSKDIFGRTVLFDAVDSGSADLVSLLLDHHDDIRLNAKDNSGRSALSHAVQYGYGDVVKKLLQKDEIDVNQRDGKGMVPILYASMEGHKLVTDLLCKRKDIFIHASNVDGRCSLSLAVQRGHESVVNTLLDLPDIDVNLADKNQRTPLSFGAQYRRTAIVRALLSRKETVADLKDDLGRTPLSYAADQAVKGEEVVRLLLNAGADQDSIDNSGFTPLKYALKRKNRGIVNILISCPTISLKSSAGDRSILSYAAQYEWTDIVQNVMEEPDIDVNGKDDQGMHALAYAAKEGYQEIVRLLLTRHDIDIASSDFQRQTPLHHAASFGSKPVIEQLISQLSLASINQLDDLGRSPLSLASLNGHVQVVKCLLSVKNLDINSTDRLGLTPLFHAASSGHLEIVQLLLEQQDIQVWAVNNQGQTVLTQVAKQGHADVLHLLLSIGGARELVDLKDGNFRTPLSYAAQHGRVEVVKRLLECPEVDPQSKDCLNTIFEYAAEMKHRRDVGVSSYVAIMSMISSATCQGPNTMRIDVQTFI